MFKITFNCQLTLLLVLVLDLFCQVASEYCGNNKYCQAPTKCCSNKQACCYDTANSSYTRGFKLHVWNMWYFWLVIIFILMSCFGGCGYYRRRRLAAMQQSLTTPQSVRAVCTSRTRRDPPEPTFYAYTGPGVHSSTDVQLPPPYTEVMQQPQLYPVNKVELPPYPGPPRDKDPNSHMGLGEEEVNPPPYYAVASFPPAHPQPTQDNNVNSSAPAAYTTAPAEHVAVPMDPTNQEEHGSRGGSGAAVDHTTHTTRSS